MPFAAHVAGDDVIIIIYLAIADAVNLSGVIAIGLRLDIIWVVDRLGAFLRLFELLRDTLLKLEWGRDVLLHVWLHNWSHILFFDHPNFLIELIFSLKELSHLQVKLLVCLKLLMKLMRWDTSPLWVDVGHVGKNKLHLAIWLPQVLSLQIFGDAKVDDGSFELLSSLVGDFLIPPRLRIVNI